MGPFLRVADNSLRFPFGRGDDVGSIGDNRPGLADFARYIAPDVVNDVPQMIGIHHASAAGQRKTPRLVDHIVDLVEQFFYRHCKTIPFRHTSPQKGPQGMSVLLRLSDFLQNIRHDAGRHKTRDIPPETGHLLDQTGREVHMLRRCGQKDRLDKRIELAVGQGHLKLIFEIRHGPQAFDNHIGPFEAGIFASG